MAGACRPRGVQGRVHGGGGGVHLHAGVRVLGWQVQAGSTWWCARVRACSLHGGCLGVSTRACTQQRGVGVQEKGRSTPGAGEPFIARGAAQPAGRAGRG